MRAIWKGSISFGLVNIPIALYPATRHEEIRFRLLRADDLSPVSYKRVAEVDGKEVPWDKIVKGYEFEKGRFVVLKEEDFKRIDLEAVRTVEITDFVALKEVDPIYFHKPYYMEPGRGGEKAYALLREALASTGKIGIAKVALKTREHLAAVKPGGPEGRDLVLELMHFSDELVDDSELHVPEPKEAGGRELEMAKTLIENLTTNWNPSKYRDQYRDALQHVIEERIEHGGEELPAKPAPGRKPTGVIDLVAVLQESISKTAAKKKRQKKSTGKEAA